MRLVSTQYHRVLIIGAIKPIFKATKTGPLGDRGHTGLRALLGAWPMTRLNARLKEASES
jgi:hypothetical protein